LKKCPKIKQRALTVVTRIQRDQVAKTPFVPPIFLQRVTTRAV